MRVMRAQIHSVRYLPGACTPELKCAGGAGLRLYRQWLRTRCELGYSLAELLIVMAILAGLAGMILPSVRGPLDKARIRRAGAVTQESLAKARSLAIRNGRAVEFQWEPGGRRFQIVEVVAATAAAVTVISDAAGASADITAETPLVELETAADAELLPGDQQISGLLRAGLLPDGTQFAGTGDSEATVAAEEPAAVDTAVDAAVAWRSVRFSPSGRASASEVIQIGGSRDFVVDVSVRSLTAMAVVSDPYRPLQTPVIDAGADAAAATNEVAP